MFKNLVFKQDFYSRSSQCVYKIAHDKLRLKKWLAFYDSLIIKIQIIMI